MDEPGDDGLTDAERNAAARWYLQHAATPRSPEQVAATERRMREKIMANTHTSTLRCKCVITAKTDSLKSVRCPNGHGMQDVMIAKENMPKKS